jgi:hypothetical protein
MAIDGTSAIKTLRIALATEASIPIISNSDSVAVDLPLTMEKFWLGASYLLELFNIPSKIHAGSRIRELGR